MFHLIKLLAVCCLLLAAATKAVSGTATNGLPERIISADLQQTNGPLNTMFKRCVGAGRANEGLRADWQRQLTIAHRECGFEYIRMHGLFTDDMGVYRDYNGKALAWPTPGPACNSFTAMNNHSPWATGNWAVGRWRSKFHFVPDQRPRRLHEDSRADCG